MKKATYLWNTIDVIWKVQDKATHSTVIVNRPVNEPSHAKL